MAPIVFKPENELKRAEELIQINQSGTAHQGLHDLIMSRKFKYLQINLEPILFKYLELSVELRKGKMARDALTQYRYHTQNTNISSLETVIKYFLKVSEDNLNSVFSQSSDLSLETVEDFEEYETPETILLRNVYLLSSEDSKEKSEKDNILSALRFRWQVFRICLDLTKNNSKLEMVAQEFSKQAFDFCLKYSRKNEFKRLCDILRGYLHSLLSPSTKAQSLVNIHAPESMQLLIDVRFEQLSTALSLELWQEAFRSIEDLHGLFLIYKKSVKPSLMILYYESLIKVFQMSGDSLFHAAAWGKFLAFVFSLPEAPSAEKLALFCSSSVLSAISISSDYRSASNADANVSEEFEDENIKSRDVKFTSLLGLQHIPDREELIKTACSKTYWKFVSDDVKVLSELVQKPQVIQSDVNAFIEIASKLETISHFVPFLAAIRRSMAHRYIQQISSERGEISFNELTSRISGFFAVKSFFDLESFLFSQNMSASSRFIAHIDHFRQIISFSSAPIIKPSEVPSINSSSIDSIIRETEQLINSLNNSGIPEGLIDVPAKLKHFNEMLEAERSYLAHKQNEYYAVKAEIEAEKHRREAEENEARALRVQAEREADRLKREEESKKREHDKVLRERDRIEKQDKLKLIDDVNKKLAIIKKELDPDVYVSMTKTEILREQARLLDEAKKEIDLRFSTIGKRLDHKERAFRLEESPLIAQQYEAQKEQDAFVFKDTLTEKKKALADKRISTLKKVASSVNAKKHSATFLQQILSGSHTGVNDKKHARLVQLEAAKAEYRERLIEQRYNDALKAEDDARLKKLEEVALAERDKEAEREKQAEEKIASSDPAPVSSSRRYFPPHKRTIV